MRIGRTAESPTRDLSPLLRKGLATVSACAVAQCLFVLGYRSSVSPIYAYLFSEGKRLPEIADFFLEYGAWVLAVATALGVASIGALFAFPAHRSAVRVAVGSATFGMAASLVAFVALTLPLLSVFPCLHQF